MTLRRAVEGDVAALTQIAEEAYAVYLPRIGRPPAPMVADYATVVREAETWVLDEQGEVVGFVVLEPNPDHLLLANVAVAPPVQGRGVGRQLLEHAERQARERGLREIRLYTHETMVENQYLYTSIGYEETGRREDQGLRRVFYRKRLPA
jgi:ribosomal protein S18 acetylase RimI-like enzyme